MHTTAWQEVFQVILSHSFHGGQNRALGKAESQNGSVYDMYRELSTVRTPLSPACALMDEKRICISGLKKIK